MLVEMWHAQPESRRLTQAMTIQHFEHFVLSKPYFDRRGLIVAEHGKEVVGFVHAAFGPNEDFTEVQHDEGVISMLQASPAHASGELVPQLLAAAEGYLNDHGTKRIVGGSHPPNIPFYHGLCGTGELPGVLLADEAMHDAYRATGYEVTEEFAVMECSLDRMRPLIDRNQRMLPRSFEVRPTMDHVFENWWETCAFGPIQRSQFQVIRKEDNMPCGSMIWWDLERSADSPGPGVALSRVEIIDERRRAGLATFLVSNALKQLKSSGAIRAQVQVPASNKPAVEFFRKLGFEEVDRGLAYVKNC